MDIRELSGKYSVSGQIAPDDMDDLRRAGFVAVISNRPDGEVTPDIASDTMAEAAKRAGLDFLYNPVTNGALNERNVADQVAFLGQATGPILAYCRSGMRSSVVWALGRAGIVAPDDLIDTAARAGYDISSMRAELDLLAKRNG